MSNVTAQESWRPIPGFEGFYDVSDQGRIRTVSRIVPTAGGQRRVAERIRKLDTTKAGYKIITLSKGGVRSVKSVHPLVLEAFVGPRPPGMEACHWDGDKGNNALSNLRWDTKKANELDAVRVGARKLFADQAECPHGHERSEANTYRNPQGAQMCRECGRIASRAWKAKRRPVQNA